MSSVNSSSGALQNPLMGSESKPEISPAVESRANSLWDLGPAPMRLIFLYVAATPEGAGAFTELDRKTYYSTIHGFNPHILVPLKERDVEKTLPLFPPLTTKNLSPEGVKHCISQYYTQLKSLTNPSLSFRHQIVIGFICKIAQFMEIELGISPDEFHDTMSRNFILRQHAEIETLQESETEEALKAAAGKFSFNIDYALYIAEALELRPSKTKKTPLNTVDLLKIDISRSHNEPERDCFLKLIKIRYDGQKQALEKIRACLLSGNTRIELDWNNLYRLSPEIWQLVHLRELIAHINGIRLLPSEIGKLRNLSMLDLYSNNLTSLPAEIGDLVNLKVLLLYNNKLTSLPPEIGELVKLETIYIDKNELRALPLTFANLSALINFHLDQILIESKEEPTQVVLNTIKSKTPKCQFKILGRDDSMVDDDWMRDHRFF